MAVSISGKSPELIKALVDAGIVPPMCRRLIIDIDVEGCVILYSESFADDKVFDIDFVKHLGLAINSSSQGTLTKSTIEDKLIAITEKSNELLKECAEQGLVVTPCFSDVTTMSDKNKIHRLDFIVEKE